MPMTATSMSRVTSTTTGITHAGMPSPPPGTTETVGTGIGGGAAVGPGVGV